MLETWRRRPEPAAVPTSRSFARNAVIENASGLRGVPHAVRSGRRRPVFAERNMAAQGFDIIGQVEGTKPLDDDCGAAAAPKLPARLVY